MQSLSAGDRFEGLIVNGRIDLKARGRTGRTQLSGDQAENRVLAQSRTVDRIGPEPKEDNGRRISIARRDGLFRWNPVAAAYVSDQLTQQEVAAFVQHLTECGLCSEDVKARHRSLNNPDLRDRGRATCRFSRLMLPEDVEPLLRELTRAFATRRKRPNPQAAHPHTDQRSTEQQA